MVELWLPRLMTFNLGCFKLSALLDHLQMSTVNCGLHM